MTGCEPALGCLREVPWPSDLGETCSTNHPSTHASPGEAPQHRLCFLEQSPLERQELETRV